MNWSIFFLFMAAMTGVYLFALFTVPVLTWLDRRIGTYPAIGCLFLVIGLAGATYAGLR